KSRPFFCPLTSVLCPLSWVLCFLFLGLGDWAAAQPCPGPGTISGFTQCLPPTPEKPPKPPAGADSVPGFVEGLSSNDAAFEVVLGQGRILTLKENLAVPGKPPPQIAVGDPSVVNFQIVSNKQFRIIGLRMGVTDLAITTPDEKTYSFEVRVV